MLLETFKHLLFPFFVGTFALGVYASDQSGFISLDCGSPRDTSYTDLQTGLNYISDEAFTDGTGKTRFISPEYQANFFRQGRALRSFPEGIRNCYKIGNITMGTKYLIRAAFLYGNYDGEQGTVLPAFDLCLGTDLWDSVHILSPSEVVDKEMIHVPRQNHVHVCLVKTGRGIPFITTLEFRAMNNASYQADLGYSLLKKQRIDAGSDFAYRYRADIYDRFWTKFEGAHNWKSINTSLAINVSTENNLQLPTAVMKTAATPKSLDDNLNFNWPTAANNSDNSSQYYVYMHFAELQKLQPNQSREFRVLHNGALFYGPYTPIYLKAETMYSPTALVGGFHNFSISKTKNSNLPPIINAWEIYAVKEFLQSETDQQDANAMTIIKSTYRVKRNWQGDPCLPKVYLWEGIDCSNISEESELRAPRVISLNLSSTGLTGDIPLSISNLTMIQTLDLSNNNLTGSIPEYLSQLPNLKVINLENNHLSGSVPVKLVQKQKDGMLWLSVCGNPNLSSSTVSCKNNKKKKNFVLPVAVSIVGAIILLLIVAAIWWTLKGKRQHDHAKPTTTVKNGALATRKRQFTYSEIVSITNNFERILGAGGFGKVYYGYVNTTQVAVKLLSVSSLQGYHQFQTEVDLLMRVHHKNLTSLVGYCNDEKNVALIYEYMANGNLQQCLSGSSNQNILKWEDRLLIATDAAQGLEYLHYGCKPPIIHRDVKTTNILLNENFQAKLSDFGLSKIIPNYNQSHVSTVVAGTPGYLDPEYYMSNRLNDKSDVYSFGVVLLEIVTGQPAISKSPENTHISRWVKPMLEKGFIGSIVDPRLEGKFNTNSAWKVVEIAMNCVSQNSTERPTMSQVVGELKEALEMGLNRSTREYFDGTDLSKDTTKMILMTSFCTDDISNPSAR